MKLHVPLFRQPRRTRDCGLAALRMLLSYHSRDASLEDRCNELSVDEVGTYLPQLGSYLVGRSFDVEIVTMHPALFTSRDREADPKRVLERLEGVRRNAGSARRRKLLDHFIAFVQRGGRVRVKIPDEEDLREEITHGRPVVALLTSNFLTGRKPGVNFHFNLVTGIDEKSVYVNDPLPGLRGGRRRYSIQDFFFGIHASTLGDFDNGSLMKVDRRQE